MTVPPGECNVSPQTVTPPEVVELSATVRNRNEQAAFATVEWIWLGDVLATASVNVGGGDSASTSLSVTIELEGRDQVRAEIFRASGGVVSSPADRLLSPAAAFARVLG